MPRPISAVTVTVLAFIAFISLGLPDTLLGVAWPSMRTAFGLPISDLGEMLGCNAIGYLLSSFFGGEIVRRAGVGRLLVGSTLLVVISLSGIAASPLWMLTLAAAFVGGLGAGAIDAGINTFAASRFSPRIVNWLHACWGIGASLSPLLMTGIIVRGHSWRIGYVVIACVMTVMFALFLRTRAMWRIEARADEMPTESARIAEAILQPVVLGQALLYLLYGGIESGAGQWLFTLLTQSRGISVAAAGTAVGSYWASLTLGRIVFGQLSTRLSRLAVIRIGLIGAVVATTMLFAFAPRSVSFLGVMLMGFALAPIFPTIISDTPRRVGKRYAGHAVGFQVAGAAIGIAAIPAGIGILAQRTTIEVLPLCLFVGMLVLVGLHELIVAMSRRREAIDGVHPA